MAKQPEMLETSATVAEVRADGATIVQLQNGSMLPVYTDTLFKKGDKVVLIYSETDSGGAPSNAKI